MSSDTGQKHGSPACQSLFRSSPVKTATTPSAAAAVEVSILVMRACAWGLRTMTACSMPGTRTGCPRNVPCPVQEPRVLLAEDRLADVGSLLGRSHRPPYASAAAWTARTMLW